MTQFFHGVQAQEVTTGPRPIRLVRSSTIGLLGTAPDADPEAFPLNTPVLIAGSRLEAQALDTVGERRGTLVDAIDAIFDQIGAVVVVVRIADDPDEATLLAHAVGGVDAQTDQLQGVHAFLGAKSRLGFQPRLLLAPGFTHQRPSGSANPVVAEMVGVAQRLRAIILADGPNTTHADAVQYREDFGSDRIHITEPWVTVFDPVAAGLVDMPPSAHVAGLIAKTDVDRGFWWSPSNQTLSGIVGTSRPIDYAHGDPNSRANLLNEKGITTIIREDGFRLWGNLLATDDTRWQFLSVRRTADVLMDSLQEAHLWAVDRNITATYYSDVAESVNALIRRLVQREALIGGRCYASPDFNTPQDIALGHATFDFDFTAPYPAQHVTFRANLTDRYLTEVF